MNGIDYVSMNAFQKIIFKLKNFFVGIPKAVKSFFVSFGHAIFRAFYTVGNGFINYGKRFMNGDWATKASYVVMGFGNIVKGQVLKGFMFLALQVAYILYMVNFGWGYLEEVFTLGINHRQISESIDTGGRLDMSLISNSSYSMVILLYSLVTIALSVGIIAIYLASTKSAYKLEQTVKQGKKPQSFVTEVKELLDSKYHCTLLTFPSFLVACFTVLPLVFMILLAFTNFDSSHQYPGSAFQWVGLENFADIFGGSAKKAYTFATLTGWTLIWAFFATFSNYILGMIFALMINKKGIKFKAFYRTLFVLSVAVPQFVTLLLMRQMLNKQGIINEALLNYGWISEFIPFLTDGLTAKITVIVVNMWVGIPYTILITSGILMNIPEELYESARIDGASPAVTFFKITLPYMLFVTTPYLITQFIGNINNFNVIYLLTAGGPTNDMSLYNAGQTDLLVTWLFNLSINRNDYNLAAAVGILVFVVCATVSLITYNSSKSVKNEEEFS